MRDSALVFSAASAIDHYVVTFDYVPATGAKPITTTVNHALHMKFGKKDVEIPGFEVKNVQAAVETVVRQAVARGVNNIASGSRIRNNTPELMDHFLRLAFWPQRPR
ncbi:MAG: hypothetical protein IPP45_10660 [Sphingomonadales bacterium]|nr:hypothetical protein [Sphingomonadales bacterium]